MAVDGVKIIDSDSAYDVYNPIMEMYHFGETIEKIKAKIDSLESHISYNELEYEIYITAYALGMWEIGGLTDELLQKVNSIVSKGASTLWDDVAPNAAKDRQKVLEKFLLKIEQPNLKVKKRKNYKQRTDFIFSPEEVFVISLEDKTFGAVILIMTFQEARTLYYAFAEVILRSEAKPTIADVMQCKVHARINLGFDNIKIVSHKNLLTFYGKFEKIGTVNISQNNRRLGTHGGDVCTFEEFCDNWNDRGVRAAKKKTRNLIDLLE